MSRENLNPDTISKPAGLFSQLVKAPTGRRMIFISGQVARDPQGRVVGEGDLQKQAVQVYGNIGAALRSAGASFSDIVKITTYLTDMSNRDQLRSVQARYLDQRNLPASTLIEVKGLADPRFLIEVEAVAFV